MKTVLVLLLCALFGGLNHASADDTDAAYETWFAGDPNAALPVILEAAESSQLWHRYYDAGLVASDAERSGLAVACLVRAHQLDPTRAAPLQALRQLEVDMPASWTQRIGPLVWPVSGWWGWLLAALAGIGLGLGLTWRGHRTLFLLAASGLVVLLAPGVVSILHDQQRPLVVNTQATQLFDSSGRPLTPIAPGRVWLAHPQRAWKQYHLVSPPGDADTISGYLPQADCSLHP